ncbi:MAG: peptidoglycan DD-metalloendopeptidase family protein, partial [Gaiellaceae bacterium]
ISLVVLDRAVEASTSIPMADGFDFPIGDPGTRGGLPGVRDFCESGGSRGYHLGDDLRAVDVPVRAAAAGRVVVAGFHDGWDGVVLIEHRLETGATVFTLYGHLQTVDVSAGEDVARGSGVGISGPPAGKAELEHLHFEVKTLATIGSGWSAHTPCPPGGYLDPTAFVRSSRPDA